MVRYLDACDAYKCLVGPCQIPFGFFSLYFELIPFCLVEFKVADYCAVKQIKILCEDLRVLGKTEFKQLLK